VADRADHRNPGGVDRAGDRLFVEGPEVFDRAPAPPHEEDVQIGKREIEVPDRRGDLLRGSLALDLDGIDQDVERGAPEAEGAEHVLDGRARGRGDDSELPGKEGKGALPGGIEEALFLELLLELLELELEGADPAGLHVLDQELVFSVGEIDVDLAEGDHLQPILGLEPEARGHSPPHGAGDLRLGILEGEVEMPARPGPLVV